MHEALGGIPRTKKENPYSQLKKFKLKLHYDIIFKYLTIKTRTVENAESWQAFGGFHTHC
jgi:hypothetical protein